MGQIQTSTSTVVASFATGPHSNQVYQTVSTIYASCWSGSGSQFYSNQYFELTLPTDPHWPKLAGGGGGGYTSDYQQSGYNNLTLTPSTEPFLQGPWGTTGSNSQNATLAACPAGQRIVGFTFAASYAGFTYFEARA